MRERVGARELVTGEAGLSQGREPGDDGSGWRGRRKSLSESERELQQGVFGSSLDKGVAVLEQRLKRNERDYGVLEE